MIAGTKTQSSLAQSLLDYILSVRDKRCGEIRAQATEQAATVVRDAFATARTHVKTAIAAERRLMQQHYVEVDAHLASRRRQQAQQRDSLLLNKARARLREVLLARWQQPELRLQWQRHAAQQANAWLPQARRWRVEHATGMDESECLGLKAMLRREGTAAIEFEPNPALEAGLRIHAKGVVLDTSLDGLLADRAALDARLLFHLRTVDPALA